MSGGLHVGVEPVNKQLSLQDHLQRLLLARDGDERFELVVVSEIGGEDGRLLGVEDYLPGITDILDIG